MAVLLGTSPGADNGADFEGATFVIGTPFVASASGIVDTITIVLDSANTFAGTINACLYTNNAGAMGNKVGNTVAITAASGAGTRTSAAGANAPVTAGTTYWVAFVASAQFNFDLQVSGSGSTRDFNNAGSTVFPATAPAQNAPFTEVIRCWASDSGTSTPIVGSVNPLLNMLVQKGKQAALALQLIARSKAQPAVVDQSVDLTGLGLANAAQFGAVSIIQDQFVSITGFQDAAQFGATAPAITVPITGFQDAAQFGTLTVNQSVSVTGLQDSAQFGTLSVDQTVPLSGFQDAAQFGTVTPSTGTPVSITGFQDAAQFGVPSADQTVPVSGLLVSAQFGGPVPDQTVNLAGFSSAAQFGSVTIVGGAGAGGTTLRNRTTMGAGE